MSEQQLKFYLGQSKPVARVAYLANKTTGEAESFEAWWDMYYNRIKRIYLANQVLFLGRDFSQVIPALVDIDNIAQGLKRPGE